MKREQKIVITAFALFAVLGTSRPATALIPVIDAAANTVLQMQFVQQIISYGKQLKQLYTELQMEYNSYMSLYNQGVQIYQAGENLVNMQWNGNIFETFSQMEGALNQAQGIANSYTQLQSDFSKLYPEANQITNLGTENFSKAVDSWQNQNTSAAKDTMRVTSFIRSMVIDDANKVKQINQKSRTSPGALSAIQSSNELLTVQSKQLAQVQAVLAAQARAEAAELAQRQTQQQMANAVGKEFYKNMNRPGTRTVDTSVTIQ